MFENKAEVGKQLEHQQKLLAIQRSNLQKLQLQEAGYGGDPPLALQNQLDRVAEQVRVTEEEIIRLKSLAAEDQLTLVEAEYRTLLAETWNTPLGRPTVAGAARLEFTRLKFGLSPERAKEMEREVRVMLAKEIFDTLDLTPIFEPSRGSISSAAVGTMSIDIRSGDSSTIAISNVDINQSIQSDTLLESSLKSIGSAIRLDLDTALELFLKSLPPNLPLDLDTFSPQLLNINRVEIHPTEGQLFQSFLTNLHQNLGSLSLPATTDPEL